MIPLIVYHTAEDDPKKCSARKLARFHLVRLVTKRYQVPKGALLLSPFAKKSLSPQDKIIARNQGVCAKTTESCRCLKFLHNLKV